MNIENNSRKLVENGKKHQSEILRILSEWPVGEYSRRLELGIRPEDQQQRVLKTLEAFNRWVAEVIFYRALYERQRFRGLSEIVTSALTLDEYKQPAIEDAQRALTELLSLAASISLASAVDRQSIESVIQKDTAFIIMAFGPHPDLQDTSNTIKRVCKCHGFNAFRADDFQDGIAIQRIHEWIARAEIIIGDLTLNGPNVFYEIGVANGKAKQPLLFRRKGTKLPFDLAAYNVPEYRNYTELESLLTKRLKLLSRN